MASASMSVDLPDPFSPTKTVTGASRSRALSEETAGTENGNPSSIPAEYDTAVNCAGPVADSRSAIFS